MLHSGDAEGDVSDWEHLQVATAHQALHDAICVSAASGSNLLFRLAFLDAPMFYRVGRLPPSVRLLTHVRFLDVSQSNVAVLPRQIGEMAALEELNALGCYCLHYLPFELSRLPRLRVLRVHGMSHYGFRGSSYPVLMPAAPPSLQLSCAAVLAARGRALPPVLAEQLSSQLDRCCLCRRATAGVLQTWVRVVVCSETVTLLASTCSRACAEECGAQSR